MSFGIDIRVDTNGDRGLFTDSACHVIDDLKLLGRFHIEQEDTGLQSIFDLILPFSDS